jgi:hypothetical protein
MASPAGRLRELARRLAAYHDELFMAPWRAGLQREARRQEDLLVTLVFLEALGVENPASYYTLELYPELVAAFHDWHHRAGMPRSPEPGVCC